jgi:hypothetical protein
MIVSQYQASECEHRDTDAGYHTFHAEETQEPHGSFEVFFVQPNTIELTRFFEPKEWQEEEVEYLSSGWYWRSGFAGCLPDAEECNGCFSSSTLALEDADPWNPEFDD